MTGVWPIAVRRARQRRHGAAFPIEHACVEQRVGEPTCCARSRIGRRSTAGSRNLAGLAILAATLADAFSALPGEIRLVDPTPVDAIDADGKPFAIGHGRNLHLTVRPDAPLQLLFTGHMDTVFAADHPFQHLRWIEKGVLGGPGVADMKGGIAVMLAALKAVEACRGAARFGYEVILNADEEVGSLGSAGLIARAAAGKRAALTYEPSALPDGTFAGARPGSGNFSFIISGKSAHAGRNPQDGRNALVAAADLALRLEGGGARRAVSSIRPGSTEAARTMSSPTARCCASTCGRARSTTRPRHRR